MSFPIALITGTGMDELFSPKTEEKTGLPVFKTELKHVARTTHGGPVRAQIVRGDGLEFLWLDRHNSSKRYCCPHEINSAAYMKMLYDNGVQFIFATSAVGGINRAGFDRLEVGSLVIPEDFIDLTKGSYTFNNPAHTHPLAFYRPPAGLFCPEMAKLFPEADIQKGGIYTSVPGPRYETRAEIAMIKNFHPEARLLGMTIPPEASLAREIAVHYCPICIVADLPLEEGSVNGSSVEDVVRQAKKAVLTAILSVMHKVPEVSAGWQCDCGKMDPVFKILQSA
ncbi:MAG: hypothetical protein COT24_04920 [Candidatus Kerfeldbacteria bacterium CG08_land_8_20_14_0_20_40_16]|uniref:Nucleoside phosphorylase domain-containing protein n=1 Tax=Candidatus Kerfeldbacteria bacterium CG08_land_8_20_14_0_20_40_16 TaxID=2014244 RepID=A0A2H0YWM7_9BACT|nr:MAG: hypothetical protein COT24_04920 [Candidatus Kerfeldbacteria bacterium CG08_land_8_20_14_0_20_40_16]